ncbi:MAG: yfiL [Myxococcaceae bacterium]|nr:yfiL [Myxococcaceae bacterium]
MSAAIEIKGLSKRFGHKVAVNDVTFTVGEGECYGLIGPNGAGKTTTFSMMCGFLFPTAGSIRVLGVDPTQPGALKGKVGVLPQDAVLPAAWPVGALLTYLARLSGLPEPEREAREALERVALPETWAVPAGAMSHGMAKRVAMAQALMGKPPVVFLDEPTAGLDPKIAAAVRQLIRELKGHSTVVVSSHNLQELEELCDSTAILDKGKLVKAGTMSEMTGQLAEFRVQIARGPVPLDEVKALSGCRTATLENKDTILVVHFDGQAVQPEDIITRTVGLLVQRQVLILSVSRGKRLEEKVLQLT